jgi:hypothetical protein
LSDRKRKRLTLHALQESSGVIYKNFFRGNIGKNGLCGQTTELGKKRKEKVKEKRKKKEEVAFTFLPHTRNDSSEEKN